MSVSFYLYVLILLTMILNWETGFTFLREVHRSQNSQRSPYQCSLLCPHCPLRGTPPCAILLPRSPFQHALVNRLHTSKAFVLLMSGSADMDDLWRKHGPLAAPWSRTWHRRGPLSIRGTDDFLFTPKDGQETFKLLPLWLSPSGCWTTDSDSDVPRSQELKTSPLPCSQGSAWGAQLEGGSTALLSTDRMPVRVPAWVPPAPAPAPVGS